MMRNKLYLSRVQVLQANRIRVVAVGLKGPAGIPGGAMNWRDAWESGAQYKFNDAVKSIGNGYYCLLDHESSASNEPGVGVSWSDYWGLFAEKGTDGREVEMQGEDAYIQWRYVGDAEWTDLVALADLKGDKGDPGTTQGDWSGFVEYVENKSLPLCLEASFSGTITALKAQSGTGTCVLQVHKNGIALGDSLAITEAGVTVSEVTIGAFAVSDKIDLVVTDNNICTDLSFTVQYVRD